MKNLNRIIFSLILICVVSNLGFSQNKHHRKSKNTCGTYTDATHYYKRNNPNHIMFYE